MKRYIKSIISVLLCAVLLVPNISMASVLEDANELKLNKTVKFSYTYNESKDNGKIAAKYTYIPDSTGYYEITLSDFIKEDTFLGVFDNQGKRLLFKGFSDAGESGKCTIKLTKGQKYNFVVFYCKAEENGNNEFNAESVITETKFPSQPNEVKCTASAGTKLGFSRFYNTALLKDATRVDIYVNFNSAAGEQRVKLFIGSSNDNKVKTRTVRVSEPGWQTLDISDISLDNISDNGAVCVGFECTDRTVANQLVSCSVKCTSDYFADSKLYSMSSTGTWYSQEAKDYVGFCAVFYYNRMDFTLTRDLTVEVEEEKPLRVVFVSDSHYGTDGAGTPTEGDDTYDLARGTRGDERTQLMIDAINAEHHKNPIDFVVFAGDLRSLSSKNLKTKNEDLEMLRDKWFSQLEMPYYAIRGNHDGYSNEDWKRIIGNDTQFTIETDDYAFICADVYDYEKSPFYDDEGNNIPTFKFSGCDLYYSGMAPQMEWIKSEVEKEKAKGKKIWIVSHHLSHTTPASAGAAEKVDETEFLNMFQNEDSIIGIIKGHAHIPGISKSLTAADSAVNDGKGYSIPKWNINTGNFGAIPLNGKKVTPDSYRFGFKVLEMQEDGLKAYHVYPEETYPRWKTETTAGVYENKHFDYARTAMTTVDTPPVNENSDSIIRLESTIKLAKHNHAYTVATTEPTCTAAGSKVYSCSLCGDTYTEALAKLPHNYTTVVKKEPTCSEKGTAVKTCSVCNTKTTVSIAALPHKTQKSVTPATLKEEGVITTSCSVCSSVVMEELFAVPSVFQLSTKRYTYNGTVKKPKVTVLDADGEELVIGTDYSVTYPSGRKNVGKYGIKIKFKGNYKGTKTVYFTIVPKATTISSVAAVSKGFTVKWKKQTTQTSGYEIQYATNSAFTKNKKTVTVSKNTTTSNKVTKLKSKTKYYVRVRAYQTVQVNGKATKLYSSWSTAKAVTTK